MVIWVFILGMATVSFAAVLECLPSGISKTGEIKCFLPNFLLKTFSQNLLGGILGGYFILFFVMAFIEEISKFLVVKLKVLKNKEFDEPIDAMLYLIIAALGFAAGENIVLSIEFVKDFLPGSLMLADHLSLISYRFISATFLHTLSSGLLGYFLALSFYRTRGKGRTLGLGIILATLSHGLYNLIIVQMAENYILASVILFFFLGSMGVIVILLFKHLRKLPNICQ